MMEKQNVIKSKALVFLGFPTEHDPKQNHQSLGWQLQLSKYMYILPLCGSQPQVETLIPTL